MSNIAVGQLWRYDDSNVVSLDLIVAIDHRDVGSPIVTYLETRIDCVRARVVTIPLMIFLSRVRNKHYTLLEDLP